MADTDLIERLREESLRLSGRSIDRGCVDSGIAANLADEAATAIAEKDARIAEWQEPPLTCPHIDAAIASGELSDDVKAELAEIRDINSQIRYGTWALRSQLTASRAECEGLRAALDQIKKLKPSPIADTPFCTGPLLLFQAAQRIAHVALSRKETGA